MAKKEEVKLTKSEIIDKCIKCVELTIPYAAAIALVWGWDIAAYTAAIGTAIIYVLKAVKMFVK